MVSVTLTVPFVARVATTFVIQTLLLWVHPLVTAIALVRFPEPVIALKTGVLVGEEGPGEMRA